MKEQWRGLIDNLGYGLNCEVHVINTVVKSNWKVDLLVLDECHRYASSTFAEVFNKVHYKLILGLTATLERLDGKEEIIKKYCPVCDTITLEVALLNHWVSEYKEYQVIIKVDDIQDYLNLQKEFTEHFEYFNFDFGLILDSKNGMIGKNGLKNRIAYRDKLCPFNGHNEQERKDLLRDITYHATAFNRVMQARKSFINNHPKKLEMVRKIIAARPLSKIVTFSNSVKMAEAIGIGKVYSGRDSKKKGRITMDEYIKGDFQVLNTIKKVDEGLDVPNISVAIQLGIDSSSIKAAQRLGRAIRFTPGKQAEMFTIVIDQSQEIKWFSESHKHQSNYITIDEEGLEDVLAGKEPKPYVKPLKQWKFRF